MNDRSDDQADRLGGTPHPRTATRLIGQGDSENALLNAYRSGRLPHAIVLGGPAGIGKATLAWRLTRFILARPDPQAAIVRDARDLSVAAGSPVAAQLASLSHPDVTLLRREVNEKTKRFYAEIRADDVRRTIGLFQRAAGAGGWRVCIVDSAEDLNRSSANALLKLIEEPPPKALFLLVAHRPGLMLPTIRSRARLMRMTPLDTRQIEAIVGTLGSPWSDAPAAVIADAAARAEGSVHDALRVLADRVDGAGGGLDAALGRLLDALPAIDWRDVHKLADRLAGRDGDTAYDLAMSGVYRWLARRVREPTGGVAVNAPRRLAPLADVWEKIAADARQTDTLNLDRRPLILTVFSDLAAAVRAASL